MTIGVSVEKNAEKNEELPSYSYQGKSEIMRGVVRCFQENLSLYSGNRGVEKEIVNCDVVLPIIQIAEVMEEKGVTKVLGQFRYSGYVLSGQTLYDAQIGGGGAGAIYLKKTGSGYSVVKVKYLKNDEVYQVKNAKPIDGPERERELEKLCKGNKKIIHKILNFHYQKAEKRCIREYVKENQLNIRYFKGWRKDLEVLK